MRGLMGKYTRPRRPASLKYRAPMLVARSFCVCGSNGQSQTKVEFDESEVRMNGVPKRRNLWDHLRYDEEH